MEVPVASTLRSRLLGLALLAPERAPPGLLIPRCRSIHTFGMRFRLDILFLDVDRRIASVQAGVPPLRLVRCAAADAVLEIPAGARAARL